MFYTPEISYAGTPPKVVLGDGRFLYTAVAKDVPVTHLMVAEVLGEFRWAYGEARLGSKVRQPTLELVLGGFQVLRFIGEKQIVLATLATLTQNSDEANAGTIRIEVGAAERNATITVSDDGSGISPEVEPDVLQRFFTTKESGLASSLMLAKFNINFYAVNKDGVYGGATLWGYSELEEGKRRRFQYAVHDGKENKLHDLAYLYEAPDK